MIRYTMKKFRKRALLMLMLLASMAGVKGQDQLIFHETFNKNYNLDITGTGIIGGISSGLGAWSWDDDRYWVNQRNGEWGFKGIGAGLNSIQIMQTGGYITTQALGDIDRTVNGRTFPEKDDVTVRIKIGKPFGVTALAAGAITQAFGIEPRISNIRIRGGGSDTKSSADHLSMGGWRSTLFGSTTKTFEIRNATPQTQIQFVGNFQTCIYDVRFYREGRPTDHMWDIGDIDGNITGDASGWMYGYVTYKRNEVMDDWTRLYPKGNLVPNS